MQCPGFSCCRARLQVGSRSSLQHICSVAPRHMESSQTRIKPGSPELAGGLPTTEPPGRSGFSSFLMLTSTPLYTYISHFLCLFICRQTLRSFHILTTMNNTAMNMGVWITLQDREFFLLGYILRSVIAG